MHERFWKCCLSAKFHHQQGCCTKKTPKKQSKCKKLRLLNCDMQHMQAKHDGWRIVYKHQQVERIKCRSDRVLLPFWLVSTLKLIISQTMQWNDSIILRSEIPILPLSISVTFFWWDKIAIKLKKSKKKKGRWNRNFFYSVAPSG